MKYETTMLLRYQRKEHPIVTDIIKKILAAALETDASADEVKTACQLTERIISESAVTACFGVRGQGNRRPRCTRESVCDGLQLQRRDFQ